MTMFEELANCRLALVSDPHLNTSHPSLSWEQASGALIPTSKTEPNPEPPSLVSRTGYVWEESWDHGHDVNQTGSWGVSLGQRIEPVV